MAAVRTFQIMRTALIVAAMASAAHAGKYQVLYTFHGFPAADGANPDAAPIMDSKGDLYGTTEAGGSAACGVVYRLHKSRSGTWTETVLHSFACGDDGEGPIGGVIKDTAGNLYGGTALGGTGECTFFGERIGCGTVYELSPGKGGVWTNTVLYSFPLPNGGFFDGPYASLTFDNTGTLYGTTVFDAKCAGVSRGSVFRLAPAGDGWKEHEVHRFCDPGYGGRSPGYGALVFDPAGNLYGSTMEGGRGTDHGVVFKLSPSGADKWTFTKIHQFTQDEGGTLEGGLTIDASGNLYGAELYGGLSNFGSIFELSPRQSGKWRETVLYNFIGGGADGQNPWQNPVFDSGGNLFGTTQQGGEAQFCLNCGVIYELVPQGAGKWSESVVYSFGSQPNIADGADPLGGLTRGDDGNFYGTTLESGDPSCGGCGVVFEFTP
jgi:uncharacterized repeat protein (TIGR03803 family)